MTIIGVVSVAALAAFGADLRAAERAQRMLPAAALAQERLATLEHFIVGSLDALPDSLARGRFDPPFDDYSWTATATHAQSSDNMVELSIRVSWATGMFALAERRFDPVTGLRAP